MPLVPPPPQDTALVSNPALSKGKSSRAVSLLLKHQPLLEAHEARTCRNSLSSTCPFLLRSTSLRISWRVSSSICTLMLCTPRAQDRGAQQPGPQPSPGCSQRGSGAGAAHLEHTLHVQDGDEALLVLVKHAEPLLVPAREGCTSGLRGCRAQHRGCPPAPLTSQCLKAPG